MRLEEENSMFDMKRIIGLKVHGIKTLDKNKEPGIILFDDGETYMELSEQDYFSYHDCATSARHVYVYSDKQMWEMFNKYKDAERIYDHI